MFSSIFGFLRKKKGLRPEYIRSIIKQVVGAASLGTISIIIILLMSFSWSTEYSLKFFNDVYNYICGNTSPETTLIQFFKHLGLTFLFPVILSVLLIVSRKHNTDIRFSLLTEKNPQKANGLIVFLSPPGKDEGKLSNKNGTLGEIQFRKSFDGSWRMPIEAITHHAERLQHIVIIPSADSGLKKPGTWRDVEDFKKLLAKHWISNANIPSIKAISEATNKFIDDSKERLSASQALMRL